MPRPRTISDEDIANAARECLLEHGPSVSTAVIATRLGVSQAALFKRMGTREAILLAGLAPTSPPEWLRLLDVAPTKGTDVRALLCAILEGAYAFLSDVLPLLLLAKGAGVGGDASRPAGGAQASPLVARRKLSRWLAAAQSAALIGDVDVEAAADALVSAVEARCLLEHLGGARFAPGSGKAFVRRIVATMWTGLRRPLR